MTRAKNILGKMKLLIKSNFSLSNMEASNSVFRVRVLKPISTSDVVNWAQVANIVFQRNILTIS